MCGRFFLEVSWNDYADMLRVLDSAQPQRDLAVRKNICPTQEVAVVDSNGQVIGARWGLVPHWMREVPAKPMINARGETIAEKPMFRDAFAAQAGGRRGFVLADGYYEWADVDGVKTPHRIQLASKQPFGFAAIIAHNPYFGADSVAIVTLAADEAVATVHNRMPVVLRDDVMAEWMDPRTSPVRALELLTFNRGAELRAEVCDTPSGT